MSTAKTLSQPTASSSAISATARGATFLILVQITSRALTFLANQLLLRYLSPSLLGASTQLELYSISVLYFAREFLRVALQRQTSDIQAVVNVSWIPLLLGLPLSWVFGTLYLRSTAGSGLLYLWQSVLLYGLAAWVELVSEPCFALAQLRMRYKVRAAAETAATIARCVITFAVVVGASMREWDVGVLPFACGQMAYALVLLGVYVVGSMDDGREKGLRRGHSLFPRSIAGYVVISFSLHWHIDTILTFFLTTTAVALPPPPLPPRKQNTTRSPNPSSPHPTSASSRQLSSPSL